MKKNKLKNKVKATNKALQTFIKTTIKNYQSMKKKLSKIWLVLFIAIGFCSCNVSRVITNQSEFYQKGDTAVTIQTKTIETYNAERK